MVKLSSRLDWRHFIVIVIMLLVLYWLLLPRSLRQEDVKKSALTEHKEKTQENMLHKHMEVLEPFKKKIDTIETENEGLQQEKQRNEVEIKELKALLAKNERELQQSLYNMDKLDERIKNVSLHSDIILIENALLKAQNKNIPSFVTNPVRNPVTNPVNSVNAKPFQSLKLVHLDLKGAPPKLAYLTKFIQLVKDYGVDGFLIEYEDMFPWTGDLHVLSIQYAYSKSDISNILNIIEEEDMLVIPLIQTFGHLEFVLKHKEFKHLRANKEISNSISPLHNGSVQLVKQLVDQILLLHPNCEWIHLGGDEVWNMNTCEGCPESNMTDAQLYTYHMKTIFEYVMTKQNERGVTIKPIIWDDMLRRWPVDKLIEISQSVTPMVWAYVSDLDNYYHFPDDMWERYAKSFTEIWLASSFKGALKPWSNFVPIQQHVDNHLSWLKIQDKLIQSKVNILGITLTGWSRFDHYGPLCELLPAGIPSLLLCLDVLQNGFYDEQIHSMLSQKLGFEKPFKVRITNFKGYKPEHATFPGADVYHMVGVVENAIGWKDWSSVRETGWTRPSQSAETLNFYHLNTILNGMKKCIELLAGVKSNVSTILEKYYESYVVEEWIKDKIDYYEDKAAHSIARVEGLIKKISV